MGEAVAENAVTEAINNEDLANLLFPDPVPLLEDLQSEGSYESLYIDEEEAITEDTAEEEASKEDSSEEEVVPRPRNAKGKRAASSKPPGDQPLDKRPRQSTTEEEFDIATVVDAIENNPLWKMSHKATLWEKYESGLRLLFERVVLMEIEAREEGKKNEEFREEMRMHPEEEKKHWKEMKEHWEEEKKYRKEEKTHREEMRKFMVAISKAFGVTAQAEKE
ncbi:hypothetical protein N5P37_002635 [Trichoderma harzianum]|jgi:hypothetical protein|uniref:Uncharacterized protein n=1 Tax=Trichoderma harzianum CBS 226.95 TaxID=983964 RepID=A0A2T4AG29_TRIHA|nr:hypothetical protein M431DRAFT_4939 [Trichoderma harzianum CBS 226.95]KAK0765157.1 hypothetical protein N5P37_002635 [Trichoderma harzianum]PKK48149.1 hypothetical protein CI102_7350 [Trichoderma harzianum]PTB56027.1 hypothetical protein M431DRAFT_4939 [Trichoderma harzianum CBS 226.95]